MYMFKKHTLNILFILMIGAGLMFSSSCSKKSYPCPGLGNSDAADLSMFGDDGELKPEHKKKGRINKETGIVNKKNPKRIRKKRRNKI